MTDARPFDILALGDPTFDIVLSVTHLPGVDDKTLGRRIGTFAGGTAANAACAAAKLGGRCAAFGRIGNDAEGRFMAADFDAYGVSTRHLMVEPDAPSALAMVMIDANGEKALVYAPMPIITLPVDRLEQALTESRSVYTMPYDLDNFRTISILARKAGTRVAIDIEPSMLSDPERFAALLSLSDIVFMNEAGFRAGTGSEPTQADVQALLAFGPDVVVVTRGARGALAATASQTASVTAAPAKVVDTTGAGDAFNGAFLLAHLEGQALDEALNFSAVSAACVIERIGARTGMADRATVERRRRAAWTGATDESV